MHHQLGKVIQLQRKGFLNLQCP